MYLIDSDVALIDKRGLFVSMSCKGDCYDNACAESFFHTEG